ncbi:2-keto-4-pentenoate hydratase [Hyphococcus sp.]|uniref:2-keto-4-pentenoate hydratase n=1 Tax=Hyphococcus sp. TaxID=2038636 RepID=UPI0035C6C644
MTSDKKHQEAADLILGAYESGEFCQPIRHIIGESVEAGYAVQALNTKRWLEQGRRIVGRKIGLTSPAVQAQLGVDQPDFGVLFADMEYPTGGALPYSRMQQPKAEAEIALVLKADLSDSGLTPSELLRAVDYAAPAIEIVGSRINNWDIKISDTIADNASSSLYVLGTPSGSLADVDLGDARMVMKKNGKPVSYGAGVACLGHPLNAALWLARTCAAFGDNLKAGDVILTGALGPMVAIDEGDFVEADISGIGAVSLSISSE